MSKFLKIYENFNKYKTKLMTPLLRLLDSFYIKPNYLSITGIIFMIFFLLSFKDNLVFALSALALSIICDNLDGSLARYQHTASDKGKFIDISADTLCLGIFIFTLAYANIINPLIAMVYLFFMLITRMLRILFYSLKLKSNWHFKIVAGFFPNFINVLSYILLITHLIFKINLTWFFIIASFTLFVDALLIFSTILNLRYKHEIKN